MTLEFVDDLPDIERSGYRPEVERLSGLLLANPGRWAVIATDVTHSEKTSWLDRFTGSRRKYLDRRIQVRTRTIDGQTNVYARYDTEENQ